MRSKEVELAINYFKGKYLEEGDTLSVTCDFLDSLDTVLNYISELEKENINWKGKYHLLSRKIDVTPNSVIRDKIKEYAMTVQDPSNYTKELYVIEVKEIEELLEGE